MMIFSHNDGIVRTAVGGSEDTVFEDIVELRNGSTHKLPA